VAREWVRVARALRELPGVRRAYAEGRLAWEQLVPLTRFAEPATDALWARRASRLQPKTLWREARRHERVTTRQTEEIRSRRSLALTWDQETPVLYLEGMLPGEEGAALERALSRRAEQVVLDDQPHSPGEARMADALVELVTAGGKGGRSAPTLVIHADAEMLTEQRAGNGNGKPPPVAETEEGVQLAAEAVRRIACEARVEWVIEREGRPVGVGRRSRRPPPWLVRLLRHRDGGSCRFPGCERRRWLVSHHIHHWTDGGPTDLDNLISLCFGHHRLLHEGGWGTSGHPDGGLRFHDPGGRPLRTRSPGLTPDLRERYFP
jgi:hypothetical protein